MTGIWPPNIMTTLIWRRIRKVSRMLLALNSLKLSAQSPPWSRKAFPRAASPRRSSSVRASPAKTIGGNASSVWRTDSRSSLLGYSGSCRAFFAFQLSTAHFPARDGAGAGGDWGLGLSETTGFLAGSAAWTAKMEGDGPGLGLRAGLMLVDGRRGLDWGMRDLVGMRELEVEEIAIVTVKREKERREWQ